MNFRTQFSVRLEVGEKGFPASVVQSGMCPSISSMVQTRSVGGNLDAYEMDGVESDAPFDSEYLDFFDIQDMIQNGESQSEQERQGSQNSPQSEEPQNSDSSQVVDNQQVRES